MAAMAPSRPAPSPAWSVARSWAEPCAGHGAPVYVAPVSGAPAYGAPVYAEPVYEPVYEPCYMTRQRVPNRYDAGWHWEQVQVCR